MNTRATIVLPSGSDTWRVANLSMGFAGVAKQLVRAGFEVELVVPPGDRSTPIVEGAAINPLSFSLPPIVSGPGAASTTASLKLGHQLWRRLSVDAPNVVLGPMAGGVLQPSLMSRALGESLGETFFVAWGEATTAERITLGDIEPAGASAVVDDALETTTLRLLDAIIGPRSSDSRGGPNCRVLDLALPGMPKAVSQTRPPRAPVDEIVFLGPASGRHGTPGFLEAIERLGYAGALRDRRVTFLGPWREGPAGLGKAMLGRRARDWGFAFTQVDETDMGRIVCRLARPGVLGVSAGAAPDDDSLIAEAINAGAALVVCQHHPLASRLSGVAQVCANDLSDLGSCLDQPGPSSAGILSDDDWASALTAFLGAPRRCRAVTASCPPSAALCITHRDRPEALSAAIASRAPGPMRDLETLVVDTGSRAENLERLAPLASFGVRLLKAPPGAQQTTARNLAALNSSSEVLVFLDDDNIFINDGLKRLILPLANADIDIVVSSLSLYDDFNAGEMPAADLVFLGEAGWAGLLFNGFGDANFAIRREAFQLVGGFDENDAAAFDWIFFAKARAAGLQDRDAAVASNRLQARTKWARYKMEKARSRKSTKPTAQILCRCGSPQHLRAGPDGDDEPGFLNMSNALEVLLSSTDCFQP